MNKARLPKPYLPGATTGGPHLVRDRMYVLNPALGLRVGLWTNYNQDRISIHNVKSGGSKGELKPN
jgi:hypothetical protein